MVCVTYTAQLPPMVPVVPVVDAPVTSVTIKKFSETPTTESVEIIATFGVGGAVSGASVKVDGTLVQWMSRVPSGSNFVNISLTKRSAPYQICVE